MNDQMLDNFTEHLLYENAELKETVLLLKRFNFTCYTSFYIGETKKVSYVIYENRKGQLGYVQSYFNNVVFSTIHKANKDSGTGFRVPGMKAKIQMIQDSLTFCERGYTVTKWKNFNEYQKHNNILTYEAI